MSLKFEKFIDKDWNLETHVTQSDFGKEILSDLKHMRNFKEEVERKLEQIWIYIIRSKTDKSNKESRESGFVTGKLKSRVFNLEKN